MDDNNIISGITSDSGSNYILTTTTDTVLTDNAGGGNIADGSIVYQPYSNVIDTYFNTDVGQILKRIGIEAGVGEEKCDSCGKKDQVAIQYTGAELVRYICKNCCTGLVDKFFGVKINPKTEQILYGNK